jgi:hypothetical protein
MNKNQPNRALRITNSGSRYVSGVVDAAVAWLSVKQQRFGCKPQDATEVEITLDTSYLAPKTYVEKRALTVKTRDQQIEVPAALKVLPPVLRVVQPALDFGEISTSAPQRRSLKIKNDGVGYLLGKVQSRVPWLSVPKSEIRCYAGKSVEVDVECDPKKTPLGKVFDGAALQVDCPHAAPPVDIPVTAMVILPGLTAEPALLKFGDVVAGTVSGATLRISCFNCLKQDFRIRSLVPWLVVPKSQLSCVAGAPTRVLIRADTAHIALGKFEILHALEVEYGAGRTSIGASMNVVRRIGG